MVESPHPEAEERLLQSNLGHNAFVLLIERNLFFEVIDHILVGVGIEDEVEKLPKVKIVLEDIKYLLFFWIFFILCSKETSKLVVVVVNIVLVFAA